MKKILIVDDDRCVSDWIKLVLTMDHYHIQTASDASEALVLFEKNRHDLVITDLQMPGMKGDKLAAALKKIAPHLPIIMVTAHEEELHASGDRLAGVDRLLGKPFHYDAIRGAVATLLNRPSNLADEQTGNNAPGPKQ